MTHRNFDTISDRDLELASGGGDSIVRFELTSGGPATSTDSRMTSESTDSGSLGNIGLADDPDGPQSQLR